MLGAERYNDMLMRAWEEVWSQLPVLVSHDVDQQPLVVSVLRPYFSTKGAVQTVYRTHGTPNDRERHAAQILYFSWMNQSLLSRISRGQLEGLERLPLHQLLMFPPGKGAVASRGCLMLVVTGLSREANGLVASTLLRTWMRELSS